MTDDRSASELTDNLRPPAPGSARDLLDADRMAQRGEEQAAAQQRLVDDLNKKPRGR